VPGWTWSEQQTRRKDRLASLRRFIRRHGHSVVPKRHRDGDLTLGHWVAGVRERHALGVLDPELVRALEATQGWAWSREDFFACGLSRLQAFVAREGTANVPKYYRDPDGYTLGEWVSSRRKDRNRGRLTAERVQSLEAVPGWAWDTKRAYDDRAFEHLLRFVHREGHAMVPAAHVEGDFPLGIWVQTRRSRFKARRLDSRTIRRLDAISSWQWRVVPSFKEGLALLKAFACEKGHARVRLGYEVHRFPLGAWVARMRQAFHDALPTRQGAALERVRGWSWGRGSRLPRSAR
jgi:hypothetical protein